MFIKYTPRKMALTAIMLAAILLAGIFGLYDWLAWGVIAYLQNAAFTWTSRSRNGADHRWHRFASWCSNGIWTLNMLYGADKILTYKHNHQWVLLAIACVFYSLVTTEGAVMAQKLLLKMETGKRKVGSST